MGVVRKGKKRKENENSTHIHRLFLHSSQLHLQVCQILLSKLVYERTTAYLSIEFLALELSMSLRSSMQVIRIREVQHDIQ